MKDLKRGLQKLTKYYGKVHCSQDNPMVSLKDVETMLRENLNNLEVPTGISSLIN